MRKLSKICIIAILLASSATFTFAGSNIIVQYTSDKSKSESLVTYDETNVPDFTQGDIIYVKITQNASTSESGNPDIATSENSSDTTSGTTNGTSSVLLNSETDTDNSSADTDAPLLQCPSGSEDGTELVADEDSFYQLDTSQTGTYELKQNSTSIMTFRVVANEPTIQAGVIKKGKYYYYQDANGKIRTTAGFLRWNGKLYYLQKGGRITTSKSFVVKKKTYRAAANGQIHVGVYKWGKYYYYSDSSGRLKTSKGFVTWNNHKYYVRKGGKIYTSKSFKIGKYTYRAAKTGQIHTGIYKWGKYYYYSGSSGKLKKNKGFVTWNKHKYYVRKGGKIYTSKSFKIGKYTYRAAKNGQIHTGVYKWGKYYNYSSSNGRLRKSAGLIHWNGKTYYSRPSGNLYTNRFFFYGANMYYAGSNAAAKTGTFKVGKYTYTADSTGNITSSDRKYMKGIDVSYWQGNNINWSKVKASGISFAFLRCGYSGTEKGECNADSTFKTNIQNATAVGLDVGAYYFSQAKTEAEARKEATFAIQQIEKSGCSINLPLVVDTENISGRASSKKLSKAKRTAVIKAFCDTVKKNGYTPMIYASTSWLNNNLDMTKLSAYKVWVAQYNTEVTYKGKYQCWQYTSSGTVSGISGRVDMNYWTL